MKTAPLSSLERTRACEAEISTRQAADWLVRRSDGFSRTDELEFQTWISANPDHRRAFATVERTWAALNQPREIGQAGLLDRQLAAKQATRTRRRRSYAFTAAGLAAAAAIALGMFLPMARVTDPAAATVAVRPDRQTLPDGSVVELKFGAEIAISFSADVRRVRLLHGEALFSVAKDVTRPFVVSAGALEVRAIGTAFSVRHYTQEVAVLVTEGRVAVERFNVDGPPTPSMPEFPPTYMGAGDRLVVPADLPARAALTVTTMSAQQVAANLAWRGKRVEFTGTSLAEAVTLFNRHNQLQLSIADPTIARLQITGIFWADDPDGFVRLLENGMSVRGERTPYAIALHGR